MSSKMNGSRRQYRREFKEEAVQLSERGDRMDCTPFSGDAVKIHQQRVCRGEIAQRGVWALPVVKGIDVFERLLPSFLANPLFGTHSSL